MTDEVTLNPEENPLREMAAISPGTPMPAAHAIAAMALTMALKYHDINTVQDGVLYQQYKLEGKNLRGLHLSEVFETSILIEKHLVLSNERIGKVVLSALMVNITGDEAEQILADGPGETDAKKTES